MSLTFTLDRRGRWYTRWPEERLGLILGGSASGPDPRLQATLEDVLARWPVVKAEISGFAASLTAGHHIPLDPPSLGGFDARTCGFGGELWYLAIAVPDPAAPTRVEVTFYTGEPDGYATYIAVLVDGRPTAITAFAS